MCHLAHQPGATLDFLLLKPPEFFMSTLSYLLVFLMN